MQIRNLRKAEKVYQKILCRNDLAVLLCDLCETIIIPTQKIDYIIHTAMSSDPKVLENESSMVLDTAIDGTKNMISLAINARCKSFVYLSSVTIYEDISDKENITEEYIGMQDWRNNKDCYMLGKKNAEFLLLTKVRQSQFPAKILRAGYIYGANPSSDDRVYVNIINRATNKKDIVLRSNGLLSRPMVYVVDVVRAIFLSLINENEGEAYNISEGNHTIIEFAETAARIGNVSLTFENSKDIRRNSVSNKSLNHISTQKAEQQLGWRKQYTFAENIQNAIEVQKSLIEE